MFKWKKIGKVFNPLEYQRGFMHEFAQAPATLVFNDFVRVYFSCRPKPDQSGQYVSYSTFVDLNRSNLMEVIRVSRSPILELGGVGDFDEFGTYPVSVFRKDQDVIMAFYAGWTRCESVPFNTAIGAAISVDQGLTFKKLGSGPTLGYSLDEPFVVSGPKIRNFNGKWYLFYIAGHKWKNVQGRPEPVYKIRCAVSDDCRNWIKLNRNLIDSRIEEDEAQASPDVFYLNGLFHMFFCYRRSENFRNRDNGYRIGYAVSEDLVNWQRKDELAGIDVSQEGWDSEMISYPHVLNLDGMTYMFYLGNEVGRYGFGLAVLESA